jgi:hypothetical protein
MWAVHKLYLAHADDLMDKETLMMSEDVAFA